VAVALSGVDGSGKSTLVAALREALEGCGVSVSVVWTRPGMRLRALERLASAAKRLLGVRETGLRQLAEGADPGEIVSRRGTVGWVWSLLVTVSYLWDVNRRSRTARGVVVFDRHLLDALATIRTLYGSVDTRLQEWLVRRLCPPADVTLWLDLPAAAATARKPDDLMNPSLVAQQLQRYAELAGEVAHLRRLDATAPADTVVLDALRWLDTELQQQRAGCRARLASLRR
jgi:thymidylate kinase